LRVQLFTGKGGVGKTTLSAATATRMASAGRKVLVVSTDPAHSLADVLDVPLGAEPTEVAANGLFAAHVDARRLVDREWARLREHLATIMAGAGVDEVAAEELSVLPGVEELLALAEVAELASGGPWEVVLVDCAPTAETLRLLALPEAIAGYLERLFPAHRRMVRGMLAGLAGGRSTVDRWDAAADALSRLIERAQSLRAMLTDPRTTSVRLVLTPERVAAAETRRTLTTLALLGIRVDGLVVNRLVPAPSPTGSGAAVRWLRARHAEQEAVLAELEGCLGLGGHAGGLPVRTVGHRAAEPVGFAALEELGGELDEVDGERDDDPRGPLLSVRRRSGAGRDVDAEFELVLALPLAPDAAVDLARIGDELAVTVDGRRRLLALPPVLRRCAVTGADRHDGGLRVLFRPDPGVWLR
jgi:arsenite/tail-anchored protein-transporting ATPase